MFIERTMRTRRRANRLAAWGITSLLSTVAGCSLLDPLNGISDGQLPTSTLDGAIDSGSSDVSRSTSPDSSLLWDGSELAVDSGTDGGVASNGCITEPPEPNDSPAREITPNNTFCGWVGPTDSDHFHFNVQSGKAYTISTSSPDIVVGVKFELDTPDGAKTGATFEFDVPSSKGGDVNIHVRPNGQPRPYQFSVTAE